MSKADFQIFYTLTGQGLYHETFLATNTDRYVGRSMS